MQVHLHSLGYTIKRAQQYTHQHLSAQLQPFKLTLPQYEVLSILAASPAINNIELARRSFVSAQTMHVLLAGLEKRGLIRRYNQAGNRKTVMIQLTAAGEKLASSAEQTVTKAERELRSKLTKSQQNQLKALLAQYLAN